MYQMLLSINPEHVENIFKGRKLYEFRKVRCKEKVSRIVIYATAPKKMVVGHADIAEIIEDDKNTVWEITKDHSGIKYSFFQSYYKGRRKAIAYKLENIEVYDQPKKLSDYGISHPPQSFIYLKA